MSTSELMQVIGKQALIVYPDGMKYAVRITDARGPNWGRIDYQVTPVSGTGTVWVDSARVKLENQ